MSSMLRQHHVKIQDLVTYLRGYDPAKPQSPEDWSKQESAGFEPGMMIFCLERVSAPSGLAFGKKEAEGETYRVKDLCVVVGRDNNKSLVVNITASAFELRYLEVLMLEKARKAILDGKDFLYVAVKPAMPLVDAKLREVEELGAMYAQGGSRRSLVVDASGPQEPAVALLAALGVKLSVGGIGKQVLDIGSICHMLFAPDGRQEDKNKLIVKSCFTAIPNSEPIGKGGQVSTFTPTQPAAPQERIRPAPPPQQPPQEWGPGPSTGGWDLQAPEPLPAPQPQQKFGYEQGAAPAPQPGAFGYDQPNAQQNAQQGFGYGNAPGEGWGQPSGPTGGFGLSGLEPFSAPTEAGTDVGQFEHTNMTPPDFGSGSAFSQPPTQQFGQSSTSDYGADQFPPSTVFNEQQFNSDQFQTPDFSHAQEIGGTESSSELSAPPQSAFSSFTSAPPSGGEDLFQPPYEGAQTKTGEHPKLPQELTSKFDPQNQLFQAPAVPKAEDVPEVNFGFDAFNQQPPSEFVDAFDTTSGAFEKTSRAMSFDDEGKESNPNASNSELPAMSSPIASSTELPAAGSPRASSTNLPASALPGSSSTNLPASSLPSASSTSLPTAGSSSASSTGLPAANASSSSSTGLPAQGGWGTVPTEDWAAPAPPSNDWGKAAAPAAKPEAGLSWTPAPADWAPEPVKPAASSEPIPAWNFDGATQAPAWTPEPVEPPSPSTGWGPAASSWNAAKPAEEAASSWSAAKPAEETASSWNVAKPAEETASSWSAAKPAEETASSWSVPKPTEEATPAWSAPTPTEEPAKTVSSTESDTDSLAGAPSLFERLNQQLEKGSISEIEPPPVVPALHGEEPATTDAATEVPAAIDDKPVEGAVFGADGLPIKSEYADTPLPPPAPSKEASSAPDPLPLGVSKKNAPLILDWPSAADFGGTDTGADTADNLNAAKPASLVPAPTADVGELASDAAASANAEAHVEVPPPPEPESVSENIPAVTDAASGTTSSTSTPAMPASAGTTDAGGGIKHLAEALSGLMGEEEEPHPVSPFAQMKRKKAAETAAAETAAIAPTETPVEQSPAADAATEAPASVKADEIKAPESVKASEAAKAETPPEQTISAESGKGPTSEPTKVEASTTEAAVEPEAEAAEEEVEEEEELSPSAALAAKGFQEPRLVMNEMASLMSKLEQQVQKAAKKLNTRAEEIKQRLLAQVDGLVADATQVEKESQRTTSNLSQRLIKQLDDVTEESRLKVSDVAANGRYTIKQLLTSNQNTVDETKNTLYESLREACKQFRIETEALARTAENDLNELVTSRTEELEKVVAEMSEHLDGTSTGFNDKLNARFERFKERMSEEASSVVRSLERNVRSMVEEIDGSWDRASDKLKSSKSDFEQTIRHSVKTAELNLSQSTRLILTNALIPKLRERQQVLRMTSVELSRRFSDESESQATAQIVGLENSLGAARQQLQTLVDECMASIDSVGRGQQAGLEEIFKETSAHAERATSEVSEFLNKIETQINDNEQTCKRLAETSSLDNDPELSNDRNAATQRVQHLRQQANAELFANIDLGCANLEQLSNKVQAEVSAMRVEQTQAVRESAENGLTRVRDAIQEAFTAIQAAREKYME